MATKKISKKTNNYSRLNKKLNVKKRLTKLRGGAMGKVGRQVPNTTRNVGSIIMSPSDSSKNTKFTPNENLELGSNLFGVPNNTNNSRQLISTKSNNFNTTTNANVSPHHIIPLIETPINKMTSTEIAKKINEIEEYLKLISQSKNEKAKNENYNNLHKYLMELMQYKSLVNTTNTRTINKKRENINNTSEQTKYFTRVNNFIEKLEKQDGKSIISYIDCKILLLYIITLFHDRIKNKKMFMFDIISLRFLMDCEDLIDYTPSDPINNQTFMINAMKFICHAVKRFTFTDKICPNFLYINIFSDTNIIDYLRENKSLYKYLFDTNDDENFDIISHNISTYLNSYGNVTNPSYFIMNPFDPVPLRTISTIKNFDPLKELESDYFPQQEQFVSKNYYKQKNTNELI